MCIPDSLHTSLLKGHKHEYDIPYVMQGVCITLECQNVPLCIVSVTVTWLDDFPQTGSHIRHIPAPLNHQSHSSSVVTLAASTLWLLPRFLTLLLPPKQRPKVEALYGTAQGQSATPHQRDLVDRTFPSTNERKTNKTRVLYHWCFSATWFCQ